MPLYIRQSSSANAVKAIERDFGQLVTSIITVTEIRTALARLERQGALITSQVETIVTSINEDLDQTTRRLELSSDVSAEASRLITAYKDLNIKTLDILHIASCLRFGTRGFVTNDKQQAYFAKQVGLIVEDLSLS